MKKIIFSLSIIAVTAAIVIGGTTAFFSNTETSSGNTFTAGAIDLKIDNTCHLNGRICKLNNAGAYVWYDQAGNPTTEPCVCSWQAKDMKGQAIFSLNDVKPGDQGEDTISLHVDSNPAWVCAEISNVAQYDNGCNSPEFKAETAAYGAGNETCGNPGLGQGELFNNLTFSIWQDNGGGADGVACDNIRNGSETYLVQNAPATNLKYAIADSQNGGAPITDSCVGVEWSVPSAVNNIAQTDSVTADIAFSAYQARHNENFLCNPPVVACGNNQVESGEECDNGASNGALCAAPYGGSCNYCSTECKAVTLTDGRCGDGTVDSPYETCDEGALNGTSNHCNSACSGQTPPLCGNGTIESGEQCDDANTAPLDGCSATCTLEPTITIHKDVVDLGNIGTKQAPDFQMTIDGSSAAKDTAIYVSAGSHAISEAETYGYNKTYSASCPGGVVNLVDDQDITCTVTNTMPYATLTVTKVVVNDNGGEAVVSDFTLKIDGQVIASGGSRNLAAGLHKVTEAGRFGYSGIYSGDCDSTGDVTMVAGVHKYCTVTNDDIPPVITLIKVDNGPAESDDFDLRLDTVFVPSGSSNRVTANVPHTITEDGLAGYHWVSITGTGCPTSLGGTITLGLAESAVCTITNALDVTP